MAGNNVYEELSPIHVYRWQSFLTFLYGWFCLQTRPVPFKVRAVVTSSDIEFNMQDIDFGFCTVYESVRRTVTITNKSVLPQPFGFCGVPDVSEITFQEWDCFVPRRVIRIPESGNFFLGVEFRNRGFWNQEFSSRNPESTAWNPESKAEEFRKLITDYSRIRVLFNDWMNEHFKIKFTPC